MRSQVWLIALLGIVLYVTSAMAQQMPKDAKLIEADKLQQEAEELLKSHQPKEAEVDLRRSITLREAVLGAEAIDLVQPLNLLAEAIASQGNYTEARKIYERVRQIRSDHFGARDLGTARSTFNLGLMLTYEGNYVASKRLIEEALPVFESNVPESQELAMVLSGLAQPLYYLNEYTQARKALDRAQEVLQRVSTTPERDPFIADNLSRIGGLLYTQGDYASAYPIYEKVVNMNKAVFGAKDYRVARALMDLGSVNGQMGDYAAAKRNYDDALDIFKDVYKGRSNPDTSRALENYGRLLADQGDYKNAESILTRAEREMTSALGRQDHPDVARIVAERAGVLLEERDYADAVRLYESAIKVFDVAHPEGQPDEAEMLHDEATAFFAQGDFLRAQEGFEKSEAMLERIFGPDSYKLTSNLTDWARLQWNRGNVSGAETKLLRAARLLNTHNRTALPTLSYAEQRLLIQHEVPKHASILLSFFRNAESLRSAYGLLFSWKGLFTDLLRRQTIITKMELDPTHRPLVERLRSVRSEIATLYQGGIGLQLDAQQQYEVLTREKESLERELSRFVGAERIRDPLENVTLEQFQKGLSKDEIFVDIYRHEYSNRGRYLEDRYAAVIVKATGDPVLIDIGSARVVETAVSNWLSEVLIGNDGKTAWTTLASTLKKVLPSIRQKHTKIWISPDRALARIPWQLLVDDGRSELDVVVSQIESARELFTLRQIPGGTDVGSRQTLNLVGDLRYGPVPNVDAKARLFESLPGSRQEISTLEQLGHDRGMRILKLKENEATKSQVRSFAEQATFVHWATHSFFYKARSSETKMLGEPLGRNPLVESGVALSEANSRDPITFEAKGLLTAEEITGWDLSQTSLVTLSACNTGRGEENTGQGISGLRSAIIAAGARSIVMSLWKVPDDSTAQFMKLFYTNLWVKKLNKAKSLSLAQKDLREDKSGKYKNPINWGAWVIAGEAW